MGNLKVVAFKDGSVIRSSVSKPDFGSIMLESVTLDCTGGFVNQNKRIAFLRGKKEQLEQFALSAGQDFNAKLQSLGGEPMKIVVVESLTPSYEGHAPKINPQTQEVITDENGAPIYYDTELVGIGSGKGDRKISTGANASAQATASNVEAGDLAQA